MELAAPFEAQAAIAAAIDGYRSPTELEQAHANCMSALWFTQEPEAQIFLKSCLVALRHKLSFGPQFPGSSAPSPSAAETVHGIPHAVRSQEPSAGNLSR